MKPEAPTKQACLCGHGYVEFWYESYTEQVFREHGACDACGFQWAEHVEGPSWLDACRLHQATARHKRIFKRYWDRLGWGTEEELTKLRRSLANARKELDRARKRAGLPPL